MALTTEPQFSRYVEMALAAVLTVVVYVEQKADAKLEKRASCSSRRQLLEWQSSAAVVVVRSVVAVALLVVKLAELVGA